MARRTFRRGHRAAAGGTADVVLRINRRVVAAFAHPSWASPRHDAARWGEHGINTPTDQFNGIEGIARSPSICADVGPGANSSCSCCVNRQPKQIAVEFREPFNILNVENDPVERNDRRAPGIVVTRSLAYVRIPCR
jgi:hypothetical protein